MIQEYNCYGDGDMMAVKPPRGNWVRYSDHLAEVERAIERTIEFMDECERYQHSTSAAKCAVDSSKSPEICPIAPPVTIDIPEICRFCIKKRVMEELKK